MNCLCSLCIVKSPKVKWMQRNSPQVIWSILMVYQFVWLICFFKLNFSVFHVTVRLLPFFTLRLCHFLSIQLPSEEFGHILPSGMHEHHIKFWVWVLIWNPTKDLIWSKSWLNSILDILHERRHLWDEGCQRDFSGLLWEILFIFFLAGTFGT